MVAFLVFIIATLEIVFGRKKLFDTKGPFGDNVIKNPVDIYTYFSARHRTLDNSFRKISID